jgi:hypothetical protein
VQRRNRRLSVFSKGELEMTDKVTIAVAVVGWLGAALILGAYMLLSLGKVTSSSGTYQWTNLVGAMGLAANSYWNGAYPSVGLNVVWMAVGAYALFKAARAN